MTVDLSHERRLEDLLAQAEFLLVQLVVFHRSSSSPHHSARSQQRLSELHRRLDVVERKLRLRATELGLDEHSTLSQIRRALRGMLERQPYRGPERRKRGSTRASAGDGASRP